MVLLVWVYYSAQVFLMGAEFTWAYAVTFGSRKEEPVPTAASAIPSKTAKKQPEQHLLEAKQAALEEDIIRKEESRRPDA